MLVFTHNLHRAHTTNLVNVQSVFFHLLILEAKRGIQELTKETIMYVHLHYAEQARQTGDA